MSKLIKSAGHGLLAAGTLAIVFYFLGAYLKGSQAFRDALDPLSLWSYLPILSLAPGAFLIWLSDQLPMRRRGQGGI
jgi:hypothetical protein